MIFFRPAFARRSIEPHGTAYQGLRAGGKPVSTPGSNPEGKLFRNHALDRWARQGFQSVAVLDRDGNAVDPNHFSALPLAQALVHAFPGRSDDVAELAL